MTTPVADAIGRRRLEHGRDLARRRRGALAWTLVAVPAAGAWALHPTDVASVLLVLCDLGCAAVVGTAVSTARRLHARRDEPLASDLDGRNDPHGVVPALDALIAAMRRPDAARPGVLAAYEALVDRLQAAAGDEPLSRLVARGYHPDRTRDEHDRPISHDDAPDESHWERAMDAADRLRDLLGGTGWVATRDVRRAIARLVPPLRAFLRARGVPTWRIDRTPPPVRLDAGAHPERMAIDAFAHAPYPAPTTTPTATPDRVSPVEDRLNATGSMALASLRPLATAFRAADPNLFHGDDRDTGEAMLDRHLPSLVDAFAVADDASAGPNRDAVRAEFARSLGFLRDSLAGVMGRHAHAARQRLEVQSRFVETRHGPDPLAP